MENIEKANAGRLVQAEASVKPAHVAAALGVRGMFGGGKKAAGKTKIDYENLDELESRRHARAKDLMSHHQEIAKEGTFGSRLKSHPTNGFEVEYNQFGAPTRTNTRPKNAGGEVSGPDAAKSRQHGGVTEEQAFGGRTPSAALFGAFLANKPVATQDATQTPAAAPAARKPKAAKPVAPAAPAAPAKSAGKPKAAAVASPAAPAAPVAPAKGTAKPNAKANQVAGPTAMSEAPAVAKPAAAKKSSKASTSSPAVPHTNDF